LLLHSSQPVLAQRPSLARTQGNRPVDALVLVALLNALISRIAWLS
jgi:hypothetical protein